jgi:hypothetical protein
VQQSSHPVPGSTANDAVSAGKARRRWPFVVLAAVVLFLVLNVYWMSREVERIRRYKAGFSQTNAASQPTGWPTQQSR